MKKLSEFIVKHRLALVCIVFLLTVVSIVALLFVNVNSDILSYLPDGVPMTEGMEYMRETFGMQGDAIVGVSGATYDEMKSIAKKMERLDGVKEGGVIWIGSIKEMENMPSGSIINSALVPKEIKDYLRNALGEDGWQALVNLDSKEMVGQILQNSSVVGLFCPNRAEGEGINAKERRDYLVMLQLNVAPSTDEAMAVIAEIHDNILKNYDHAIGGSTQMTKDIFDSTINEIWKYLLVAILVMFIILLLTTTSLVEPFIFMLTLGVSIVINMGTNLILPSVSVVTFAASSILQLGLSMDYAIFMMHAYAEERKHTLDDKLAMSRAIPKTFSTITSSALTTVGGFIALFFMKFKIGADLGIVLAKGVFLSLLTIIFLQPCLMLMLGKLSRKTQHRIMVPKLRRVASFSVTHRKVIVALALVLLIPCIFLQNRVGLTYIKFVKEPENPTQIQQSVNEMSNSLILIVPADEGDYEKNKQLVDQINGLGDEVQGVMGVYAMLPDEIAPYLTKLTAALSSEEFSQILKDNNLGSMVDSFDLSMLDSFISNGYTMYSVMLKGEAESQLASDTLSKIHGFCEEIFGADGQTYYVTGMTQAVEDLRGITPTDFTVVTVVSVLMILVVLLFALKSVKLSALLIAVIEFGIFINLTFSFLIGQQINFMAYIIISSIQLGATVDYAILYTVKYQRNLEIMPAKEAAYRALRDSGVSIITSVAIMAGCCLSVSLVTSNVIVGEITLMIARGSIISGILVMVLLPALLVVFTSNKKLKKEGRVERKKVKKITRQRKKQGVEQQIDVSVIETAQDDVSVSGGSEEIAAANTNAQENIGT